MVKTDLWMLWAHFDSRHLLVSDTSAASTEIRKQAPFRSGEMADAKTARAYFICPLSFGPILQFLIT